ncbi:AAA family ATPase, partial [Angustibacter aerolatus]
MRLHRLEVTAFGPFADRQVVDLDALGTDGLFLLHGPTGAGKSSLLDAVCFALYGRVPGARATGRPRLRSDHAAPDVGPLVVLEATLGGRRFEVRRSPEWHRPKRRGAGTTLERGSVAVRELVDGEWVVHEQRRADEAGLLLRDLLGMDLQQFTKVVMLPQGEFAAFLRAGADERRDLLSRLFDIDRYDAVERWLREERTAVGAQVHTADARQALLVARAEQAVHAVAPASGGGDDEVVDELAVASPDPVERVAAMLRGARAAADAAELDVARHGAVAQQAATTVQRLGRRAARCERLRALHERHDRLVAIRPRRDADAEQLARARAAAPLRYLLDAADRADAALADARTRHEAAVAAVPHPAPQVAGLRDELAVLQASADLATQLALATDRCAGLQREA